MTRPKRGSFSWFVFTISLAGIAVSVGHVLTTPPSEIFGDHPLVLVTFAVLLIGTELRPMLYLVNGGEVTASWTFAFAMLFIAPPAACLVIMAIATISSDLVHDKPLSRAMFNAGQSLLALAAGIAAGSLVTDLVIVDAADSIDFKWMFGAGVAFVVAFGLNVVLIAIVIALHQGVPIWEIIRRSIDVNLAMDGLLLTLAPVFVIIGLTAPLLIPLVMLTTVTIYRSATIAMKNQHEATHDLLTGIPNRRLFEDHAAMMLRGAEAAGRRAAIVQIDLDGFKGINDRLGHHYGDVVLKIVAERLQAHRRPTDHVSRLGGDEFAIAIGEIADEADALAVAQRVLEAIEVPMEVEGIPLAISASLGVAIFPAHGEDLQGLLHNADTAMYEAKGEASGVRLFVPTSNQTGPNRIRLMADLADAIGTEQLRMEYQPRIEINTGRIASVEALLRWDHPVHGTVAPGWFMPQTEQTELMNPLTDSVIDMSLAALARWRRAGLHIGVAVNISARNLHDLRFPRRVAAALETHGIEPGWLEVEITENTVMADPIRSESVLGHLRSIGVRISIDDFGTGYSSLASLRNLTIDCIKIDRSFVTDLDSRGGDLVIVQSIVDLARNLGLQTVAEGVETQRVYEIVRDLGCDDFQGFLSSPPVAESAVEDFVRAHSKPNELRAS